MSTSEQRHQVEELLQQLLRSLLPLVDADLGGFFVFDEQLESVEFGAIQGLQPPQSVTPVEVMHVPPDTVAAERWILTHGRPLHLYRRAHWRKFPPVNPGLRALAERNALAALVLPLHWEDEVVGVAYFWRHRNPRPFTLRQRRVAERWCRIAAIVAVASRLYQRERTLRSDLERLIELDRVLDRCTTLDDAVDRVLSSLAALLSVPSVLLALRVPEEPSWQVFATPDLDEVVRALRNSPIPWESFVGRDSQPVIVDRARATRVLGSWTTVIPEHVTAIAVFPFVERGSPVAITVACSSDSPPRLSPRAFGLVNLLHRQLGAVLHRLSYEQALQRRITELRALYRIAHSVTTTQDITRFLEAVDRIIRSHLRYDALIFLEPDPRNTHQLVIRWGSGSIPEAEVGYRIPLEHSLAGYVFRTGRPLHVPDTREDPRTYHRPERPLPLRSVFLLPVRQSDRTTAVLGFGRLAVDPFSEAEREFALLLTREITTALAVIDQRQELQRQVRIQETLNAVSEAVLRSADPRQFAEPVVAALTASTVPLAALYLALPSLPSEIFVLRCSRAGIIESEQPLHFTRELLDWLTELDSGTGVLLTTSSSRLPDTLRASLGVLADRIPLLYLRTVEVDETASGILLCGTDDERDLATVRTLVRETGERVARALERWTAELERRTLERFLRQLGTRSSLEELAQTLLSEIRHLIPFDFAAVLRFTAEPPALVSLLTVPPLDSLPAEWELTVDDCCLCDPRPDEPVRYIADSSREPRLGYALRVMIAGQPASLVSALLRASDHPFGIVLLGRFGADRFFPSERRRLAIIAASAALAFELQQANLRERTLYRASIEALAAAIDAKDPSTHDHSRRVARLSRLIAQKLELPPDMIEEIELAALLHDIGKLAIPDSILRKPTQLTEAEWALIRTHPSIGAEILATHPRLAKIARLVRWHHERWDGKGYPDGLREEAIPLGAAIIGLADAFDTMISDRPYRPAIPFGEAVEELRRCRGSHFHPSVVDAFLALLRDPNSLPAVVSELTVTASRAHALRTLFMIGELLPATADLMTLAEVIDIAISGSLSNDNIVIFLLDHTEQELWIAYSRHDSDLAADVRLPRGTGLAWKAIETMAPIAIDLTTGEASGLVRWGRRDLKAVLVAPVLEGGKPVGALAVSRTEARPFSPVEADLLATLGRCLAPTLASFRRSSSSTQKAAEVDRSDR